MPRSKRRSTSLIRDKGVSPARCAIELQDRVFPRSIPNARARRPCHGRRFLNPPSLSRKLPTMPTYAPDPKMKFTFGLWTVGNPGRDPFGLPTRQVISPVQICELLGEVGAHGVNFHDNDLIPIDATAQEADRIKRDFKKALKD